MSTEPATAAPEPTGLTDPPSSPVTNDRDPHAESTDPAAPKRPGESIVQTVEPVEQTPIHSYDSPLKITATEWRTICKHAVLAVVGDRISLAAAGCGFYATLALFPTISMLISMYGLAFDLQSVEPQLQLLHNLLPTAAADLIADRIHVLVERPHAALTLNLAISLTVTLWSASAGTKSMLSALNMAYNFPEIRSFLKFQGVALGMTFSTILGAAVTLALLVALPVLVAYFPARLGLTAPPWSVSIAVRMAGPLALVVFVTAAFATLYRIGPSRTEAILWRWVMPGALIATALWIVSSIGFSFYVSHVGSFDSTYGPLGAVIALMMWSYASAFVALLGAEINACMEALFVGGRKTPQLRVLQVAET
ncbi:t-RNA-processing ribonuclease BN [Ameyamaea chiangmaiensis NBRC 103196]|uniref:YihY/virulence factor BrkB family protein n=1 Tax=Ameyamaea chiangmaiensis TaxID=442969 RepID=A0A850P7Z1_9PROT|nr:YihY/virulence factor BrkB family protein [Ameyamaea chiangmaiensis]MBS4073973.1 YihY/virulence factor BrkB family protein [Ameyamaea chiangmaiensis]NVN40717.1 YihY/virulence factor BrkB family protein [Ameyamaea chiangmaiensis]GBQ67754.1 t-RNA-processing ribonuclease BN [Ameyamaea chiangmaiensis NBRC 103196]